MKKLIKIVLSENVEDLNINQDSLGIVIKESIFEYDKSNGSHYLIEWIQGLQGWYDMVIDGNLIKNTNAVLPEKIWVIFDEYDDFVAATLLLPEER